MTDEPALDLVPAKVLGIEALMPGGTIEGKSTAMAPDTPEEVLAGIEGMLMQSTKHDYPDATDYRSLGWVDTYVPVEGVDADGG